MHDRTRSRKEGLEIFLFIGLLDKARLEVKNPTSPSNADNVVIGYP